MNSLLRALPVTVLLLAATACTSSGTSGGPAAGGPGAGGPDPASGGGAAGASCALAVQVDGATYLGSGRPGDDPDPTGRTLEAVVPPCDDTGGQGPSQSPEPTSVDVLRGVDPSIAVGWQGFVMVRQGATYPAR